ncbi:MAG: hypothetical protein AAGA12_14940 [Pseudomonadota bacterium]
MTIMDATLPDLRPPSEIMRLSRLGSMFPTRLSFLRVLMRELKQAEVAVTRPVWDMDADGYGHAVYTLNLAGYAYSLVCFSNRLDPEARTDRVIAEAWDSAFVLYDGVPDAAEIARLSTNAPRQEAGRFTRRDLVLSRANKSVRLFDHVVSCLRNGQQPDADQIAETGYLMRTTAVYGNGKFGIADRSEFSARPGLGGPFAAEMLTVWLIRGFTHDLVEHVGGAPLDITLKRHLGIGNSTGLGMAPFLVSHPDLLNNWMMVRETALSRAFALANLDADCADRVMQLAHRASRHLQQWNVPDTEHQDRIETLRADWEKMSGQLPALLKQAHPLFAIVTAAGAYSDECQELAISLVLEPLGDLVDGLACCMVGSGAVPLDPMMDVASLSAEIEARYEFALRCDFDCPSQTHQFWYVSAAKQEPRLGLRYEEPGAELESPLDIARQVQALASDLRGAQGTVARFLRDFPHHRAAVRRVQLNITHPYSEIHDNLIAETCKPIDMLRCKLSFFGASKFDPKSDRWTRITLAQGAPLFGELADGDDWWLPVFAP